MARPSQASLDDSYSSIKIMDFSGGCVTTASSMSLAQNQSPEMLNVIPLPGRLIFRGGFSPVADLPAAPDNAVAFYDSNHTKHWVVWCGGSIYDCVSGVAVLVQAAAYTGGQNVGAVELNGVLYWSTQTVPLSYWNPAAGTTGQVVSSGVTGAINPPKSDFLFLYTNCIVALAPTWGLPDVPDVYQPNVFCWSNVNDPETWIGANSQAVGDLNSGRCEYGRPFGIAGPGVSPTRTILIFRDDTGIFAYAGALGQLEEKLLNCPFGISDRFSAQYLPTSGAGGHVAWLSNDGQIWETDGLSANPISQDILPTLSAAYYSAISNGVTRFYSGYNQQWQYYYVDLDGAQFGYRWQTKAWFPMYGMPSGPSFQSFDSSGLPAYFIAGLEGNATNPFILGTSTLGSSSVLSGPSLCQVMQIGYDDNGTMPSVYWKSPILHAGDFEMFKEWHWGCIATYDSGATYNLDATSIRRSDSSIMTATTLALVSPQLTSQGTPFVVGTSLLAGINTLGNPSLRGTIGTPIAMQERFTVPVAVDEWMQEGEQETLKGCGIQLTISWADGPPVFDLLGVEVLYVPRGYLRGAGALNNAEDVEGQPFDPWSDVT